jgi:hypothetical protein
MTTGAWILLALVVSAVVGSLVGVYILFKMETNQWK